jgi:hypothetical protein
VCWSLFKPERIFSVEVEEYCEEWFSDKSSTSDFFFDTSFDSDFFAVDAGFKDDDGEDELGLKSSSEIARGISIVELAGEEVDAEEEVEPEDGEDEDEDDEGREISLSLSVLTLSFACSICSRAF